jgi:hypothetical protein
VAKDKDDDFADEFEGDEFEDENFSDEGFDLTDENTKSEHEEFADPIARANERAPSFIDKLTAMKTPFIIVVVAIVALLGFLMFKKNNNSTSKELVDTGSKYASNVAIIPEVKPEIRPIASPALAPSKESLQAKPKQDLAKPVEDNAVIINDNKAVITGMESKILSLSNDLSSSVEHIKQLSEVIIGLKSAIADVNQTLSGMDNRILSLTETVDHLNSDVSNVKHIIKDEDLDLAAALDKQPNDTLVYNAPAYVVHAIIPGRAWLKTDSGQIITVTEGDDLGDYGKVSVIDASNGIIRTSSGVVFK